MQDTQNMVVANGNVKGDVTNQEVTTYAPYDDYSKQIIPLPQTTTSFGIFILFLVYAVVVVGLGAKRSYDNYEKKYILRKTHKIRF